MQGKILQIKKGILKIASRLENLNIAKHLQVKQQNLEMVKVGKIKMVMYGKKIKNIKTIGI